MLNALSFAGSGTASLPSTSTAREDFLKLLTAQLSAQDPLDPIDNGDFMQQIVALQTVEQTSALSETLRSFERFQQLASGSALIGREISGLNAAGQAVSGAVARVALEDGRAWALLADGSRVAVDSVTEIR